MPNFVRRPEQFPKGAPIPLFSPFPTSELLDATMPLRYTRALLGDAFVFPAFCCRLWGRYGFDGDAEIRAACRGRFCLIAREHKNLRVPSLWVMPDDPYRRQVSGWSSRSHGQGRLYDEIKS